MPSPFKNHLYAVISGTVQIRHGKIIRTIANYLREGETTSADTKGSKQFKAQERQRLKSYLSNHHLWVERIDLHQYVSEGAEQKVFLKNEASVLKLNDTIYYESWVDYFHNLLLHNTFFEDTAYQLLGFYESDDVIYAVVEQPFVEITSTTNLTEVKQFLAGNGFTPLRNNDYFHPELGIILEDLHDENVLTKDGLLYFIDTVFYLTEAFWEDYHPNRPTKQ